jgi:nucleoside-diphosphate-sugar epimerase
MNLFVFGLGYSANYFWRRSGHLFQAVVGTVRDATRAAALNRTGLRCFVFDGQSVSAELVDHWRRSDVILDSIPPARISPAIPSLLRTALASTPRQRQIIYLSTIGVYGDHDGRWVDEDTAPTPNNDRSQARLMAEALWLEWAKEASARVSILRLAGIYGPNRNALVALRDGTAKRIVKPGQLFNRIHVEDIARSIASASSLGFHGVVNVTDDEPAPPQDVIAFAARLLQLPEPPAIGLEAAGLSAMGRSFYAENKRVSNKSLKRDLGVTLAYPTYREGLQALFDSGEGR